MKRRVLSLIITLALCLNLCPVWGLAADEGAGGGLCPHHPLHTDACGYASPALDKECTHNHDGGCYITKTDCIHSHTAGCYPDADGALEADKPVLCAHLCAEDSGCVTRMLSCPHEHNDACGYALGNPGAPCTFVCSICPIEDLISKLPRSVSVHNAEQIQVQIDEIYALYDGLSGDEQRQVDLSPCVSLWEQLSGMGAAVQSGDPGNVYAQVQTYTLDADKHVNSPYTVSENWIIDTNTYTFTATLSSALQVAETGVLDLRGTVISEKGSGVEVLSGGTLRITEPGTSIRGSVYALDIASGAKIHLSTGRYFGNYGAIRTADGDFTALLAPGCAYFDDDGAPILPADVALARTVVVAECTDHGGKSYEHTPGTTEHAWTCPVCGTEESEPCTFTFQDRNGTCALCGNTLTIAVDEDDLTDLVYDGTIQPEDVTIAVTLTDGSNKVLVKGTDYEVKYEPRKDAGEIEVTVTGITFNGTFTKTYTVDQDRPALAWDTKVKPVPVEVDYDGEPVEASTPAQTGDLPPVKINILSTEDNLQQYLQYSYKKQGDADYTDGLPTNAGTYDVIVSLPEMQNFEAAVSEPITLTIRKINPIVKAPEAAKPVYNGAAQELVTAGTLDPVAKRDGLEIQFSENENGPYSTAIPVGTSAGTGYRVWYKVVGLTDNYTEPAPNPAEVTGVEIQRKPITPVVELSQTKYQYDGDWKEPAVTVKDGDTVLPTSEYSVTYENNRDVSTPDKPAKVIVTDKAGGNYDITEVTVTFQITLREQAALSITGQPRTVTYGDQFTLGTSGGSGNGLVTWEVIDVDGVTVATVGQDSGQVTITGDGKATVKATKSGRDPNTGLTNYADATATWTLEASKKSVTATVTAEDKDYDGDNEATIHAVVEQGVLPGDVIDIQGLTGTFDDENAGVDKNVTVDTTGATITGKNSEHYTVLYSSTTVKATIHKAVAKITTAPVPVALTYDGTERDLIANAAVVDPAGVPVEYALSEDGPYSTAFPKGTNAGDYTVWYRIQETANYTGEAPASIDVTIAKKSVAPVITLDQDTFVYDGTAKEPVVTLTEADGTTVIPAGEYTVEYSDNTNVGTATVTVKAKDDGNYSFNTVTENFTIGKKQAEVTTAPEAAGEPLVFNTRAQKLVTAGAGTGGTMVYSVDGENGTYLPDIPTKTDAGDYTVHYKVKGDSNHSDSEVGSVIVTISPKTVKDPLITLFDENGDPLVSYTYDGKAKEPTATVVDGSTIIDVDEYEIRYENNTDAGNTATVNIIDKPGGNYTVSGSKTFVIEKADIVFNPAPSAAAITYDGKPHELLVPGTTSGGEVLYALNSATSTYTAAIPQATLAGDYTVYYKVVGDKNHNDYAVHSVPVTIQRKPLTDITIELTPDSFEYDGTVKLPTVTVKFKAGKIETVVPETEYDWTCSDSAPTNQGTYTITITDATGGNYDLTGVTANTATFTIGKTDQAPLVIEDKPTATIYGGTFTLTTSGGSSSSAVTWEATGPATVDENTGDVEITGVGEVTVTATNPGDTNYLPVSAQWTFTAAPKPVTASVVVGNRDYDGTTDATVTSASVTTINGDTVTIDLNSITAAFDTPGVGTGKNVTLDTSKVKVTGADAAKYAIRYPDAVTADITQATTTITTAPAKIDPLTYNGQPQALVTTGVTNVGFLVYSLDGTSFSPDIPTGTNAGTYTVYYKVDGTADYTGVAVNTTPVSVTIAPKTITPEVELSESSFLYDGTKKEPKITVKDGKTVIDEEQYTVTWANDDTSVTDGLLTAAGTYTAAITNVANGNYSFNVTAQVEITKAVQAALEITGQPAHVYYGDRITTLGTSGGTGDGTVKWSVTAGGVSAEIDENLGVLTIKGTGSITVKAERTVPNYGPVSAVWTFTVEPKPVLAEVTVTGKVYDGTTAVADTDIAVAVKASDLVDPDNDTITITAKGTYDNANVGTGKTVTLSDVTVKADTAKYTVAYPATAKGDITPRGVTVTVTLSGNDLQTDDTATPPYFYNYDGTEKKPNVTVTANDDNAVLVASDYSVNYTDNKNVGDATVTVTAKAGGNYTFAEAEVKFAIKKTSAELTKAPAAKNLTYTGQPQDLVDVGTATGGTVVYSKTGADGSYSETIPQETNAGTYTVYYMVKGDANHADTAPGQVSVTIKPKEITPAITLNPTSFVYDGAAKTPGVTVKDGTDTIDASEYTVSYQNNTNAGTATVTVSDNNGGNYIVNGTATFEITKKVPTFTAPAGIPDLQYNGAAQELVTAGVCHEGTVLYSVNGGNYSSVIPEGMAVDTYTIDYKVLGDANHSDTVPVRLTVEIGKNKVTNPTISLSQDTFIYNGNQQKPIITVYDNNSRLIPEHEYVATITGTNGNNGMVDVDTYTITITTPSASNYDMTNDGTVNVRTFEIRPAGQEAISITGTQAQVHYGDTIQLGTTGGSGDGNIHWKVEAKDGSTITSTISPTGLLTVKDVGGPLVVTATRSIDGNHTDVSAAWEFSAGKKPVTAVLTGVNKPFDGNTTATVKAKVAASDLVFGDTFTIPDLTGTFDNPNVGTNKTITITGSAPTISDSKAANYEITYPDTATASILAKAATVDSAPEAVTTLIYDASQAQELVTAGTVTGGILVYSLNDKDYAPSIPKAKDAGEYTVYYKAQGDNNHTDSAVGTVEVTIGKQTVAAGDVQIELTPPSAQYDGEVKRPTVTVRDKDNNVIPESEYKRTYVTDNGENWTDQGTYTVKVENISGGNYVVETATADFTISITAQNPLEIVGKPGLVYYGNTFTLSAVGGSGNGKVAWSSSDATIADIDANGFVTIKGVGPATITATKPGGGNYDTVTADYPLNALKKPVTAIVTADDKVYDGNANATLHVTWEKDALVGTDEIKIQSLTGTFADERVGANKTVTFTCTFVSDTTSAKYDITLPPNTTASITKADATAPALTANDRVYDGTPQDLVSSGGANTLYSSSRDGVYTATVPTGTNAGTYTVWYKEKGDANHNDSEPQAIQVTISQKTLTANDTNVTLSGNDLQTDADGTYYYTYDGSEKQPSVIVKDGSAVIPAREYTVSYSDNRNVGEATVTITNSEGGNYIVSGNVTFEIRKGSAELATSPQAKVLEYTGQPQELVTVGTVTGGHIEYALDGGTFSKDIPVGTNAGTYTVTYKAVGDGNHESSTTVGSVTVTIKPKEVISPKVTVSGNYTYDGNTQEPAAADIEVKDGTTTIPADEYKVTYRDNINAGTATVIITNANGGNYIVNGTGTFEIAKGIASVATAPKGLENLPYNGTEQALAEAGTASNGTMVYALSETGAYSTAIPTGKDVGTYTVWYKVQGDSNHEDSTPASVSASIIVNTVTAPTIKVTPETVTYNEKAQEPTVTVQDNDGFVIDGSEYTVTYQAQDGASVTSMTNVGKYTLTITGTGTHYAFTATAAFEILPAGQTPLTITGTRERVYYGDTIQLGTTGGNGTVAWAVSDNSIASITNGLLKITGVGSVTVTATSTKTGYDDQIATWTLYAEKKPVTAVVTAASKTYDGISTATVTAELNASDLVDGDTLTITLSGSFEDSNAGTDKKVKVDSSNPQFSADSKGQENYRITYPSTTTASIFKAAVDETKVTAPIAKSGLEYTGLPQTLVTDGSSPDGIVEYSLDGKIYSASLPTGTDAGDYEVWYRVKGDSNHNDTAGKKLGTVTIAPQNVTSPIIEFTPSNIEYDGKIHKPAVAVKDNEGRVIPSSEYEAVYDTATNWTSVGNHKVTIKDKEGGNYTFSETEKDFTILPAGQGALSIVNQPGKVQYGDTFTLAVSGGTVAGAVTWTSSDPSTASIEQSGLVTVHKSGPVTITAERTVAGYATATATWTFRVEKKPITPVVTAKDKEYDGNDTAKLVITWKDGDLLNGDSITFTPELVGQFDSPNVGTDKTVTITGTKPTSDKYEVKIPSSTTASITPKPASVTGSTPVNLTYNRTAQKLVTGITAENGDLAYSRDGSYFTLLPPEETNAGTYTVWYKAQASGNYQDSVPVRVNVTIAPKPVINPTIELSSKTFDYDGTAKEPSVVVKDGTTVIPSSEYTVSYSNNVQVGTATVTITDNPDGNYDITGKTATFTIKAGAPAVAVEPEPRNLTYNGREQTLVTRGTPVNGHMEYSFDEYDYYSTALPKGTDAGVYEVWYKVVGDDGTETIPELVIAEILPRTVIPTITVNLTSDPLPYTGRPQKPPVTVIVEGKTLTNTVDYTTTYSNNTNVGTATVNVQSVSGGNYQFSGTATFEIAKSKAEFAVEPEGKTGLVYTGEPQELIEELTGMSLDGIVVYSQDLVTYSAEIPTGTKVRTYTIFAKVLGDATHEDSDIMTIKVAIGTNVVSSPTVTLSQNSFKYDGTEHKPTVTVTDDNGNVIPAGEYTASYSNNINVGTATVTIKNKGTNYQLDASASFQITGADQPILTITGKQDNVVYGDTLYLGATGGTGTVTWSSNDANIAAIDGSTGVVTTKKSGSVTITATSGSLTDTWTFTVAPKPVTAVVIAAEKSYDTSTTATLTVTLSGLVAGDTVDTVTATGHFMDANVGTNKTVIIDSLTIPDGVKEKYTVTASPTTTGTISPAAAKVTDAPKAVTNLTYTGSPQTLVSSGTAEGGELVYSLDGGSYSYNLPTATNAGSYTVRYKVAAGDENHKDSAVMKVENVTIGVNKDTPTVLCTPNTIPYDGTEKTPTVVVRDSQNRIIPESEYTVELPNNRIAVGTYTVTVKDNLGGNYEFSGDVTGTFQIVSASQNPLSITDKPAAVRYGDTFTLSAIGGSGSGAIHWSIKEGNSVAVIDGNGVVTVTGVGGFTVEAYRAAADGYSQSNTDSVPFDAKPKPVTPVVTADDKPYDGTTDVILKASWKSGDLVRSDTITLTVAGKFATPDAGTGKKVEITSHTATGDAVDNYIITWPDSTTAQIYKVDAKLAAVPAALDLTYNGSAQPLVAGGTTEGNIGVVVYSTSEKGGYSTTIPTGTDAGTYTVWYKVADSVNYTGVPAASIEVEIKKATPTISTSPTASGTEGQSLKDISLNGGATDVPGKFAWKDGSIVPGVGTSQQDVMFTPDNAANYNVVEFQIDVTVAAHNTSSTNRTPMRTTVQNGTASTVVSAAGARKLVQEAAANQSDSIVLKPNITGEVTKTQVSIPASTVSQIKSETNAALTVSAPIADVTIPHAALDTLGRGGGTVNVVTEQVDQSVVLTLTAGGENVKSVPGGLTLTVPAEDAGPGTVAVLLHEDGTRETLRKSIAEDGKVSIPLSGSATVEIVDNSKDFTDVPPASWAADAVAFASAHELFSGTSETTFEPDQAMSRGMLATVLYSLEGCEAQDLTSKFSDVSSDTWYADGVAWATENGIANGYGNGQFGPNDSITREQFAVMLWKYAGSPKASGQVLDFTDADQASGYALEALSWAVENGILNGCADGQLAPGETATRAQAAQMLKNFMESTCYKGL